MEYDLSTDIVQSADDFYEVYKRCRESRNPRQEGSATIVSVANIPAIVNGAFSCELYLKYLLPEGNFGHDLYTLFNELDESTNEEIIDSQSQEILKEIATRFCHDNFDSLLFEMGKVFVDWRYIYEQKHAEGFYGNRINKYLETIDILINRLRFVVHERYSDSFN